MKNEGFGPTARSSLKRFFAYWWALGREIFSTEPVFDRALILFAALGLMAQLAIIASYLDRNADHQSIIASIDNDAGVAVSTALNTKLYDDNGWRPYGPVYYRLVRLAHTLAPASDVDHLSPQSAAESLERAHHFLLMLVSLFSMGLLALFLASLLTGDLYYRLILTIGLIASFAANPVWTDMIIRAHPDHIFALTVAFAMWRTWLWIREPDRRAFLLYAGAAWGLATATKLTVLLFAPTLLLLLIFPWNRTQTARRIGLFLSAGFLVYQIVCFPQGFSFAGVIQFLIEQQRNVLRGDLPALLSWLSLFGQQLWRPICILVIFSLLVPLRNHFPNASARGSWLKLAALMLLPVLFLISRKIISPFHWYPLPFVASLLVGAVVVLQSLVKQSSHLRFLDRVRESRVTKVAVFFLLAPLGPSFDKNFPEALTEQLKCRSEAREVESIINGEAALGGHILVDPVVPYARAYHDKEVEMAWQMYPERIKPGQTKIVALNERYYRQYFPKDEDGTGQPILHIANLEPTREFYRRFRGKTETTDWSGKKWTRIHVNRCKYEVWKISSDSN